MGHFSDLYEQMWEDRRKRAADAKPEITGYRVLSALDILAINELKLAGQNLLNVYERMERNLAGVTSVDRRWLSIAKTDLQTSVMAAVRSIAQPEGI